jgi:hypothetical protein
MSEVGKTKAAGWEVGVRDTVPGVLPLVWKYLVGPGLHVWLGDIDALPTEKAATVSTIVLSATGIPTTTAINLAAYEQAAKNSNTLR